MALYTIADLHLSHATDKPMSIFGSRWTDHREKIRTRWSSLVEDSDTVVIPGDISWAMTLEEAAEDFRFIDSLPGRKIISKGNHDYYWTTASKMTKFFSEIGVTSINLLHNNAYVADGFAICGSRGWFIEEKMQGGHFDTDHEKLVARECMRLDASLKCGCEMDPSAEPVVFLHFPPVFGDFVCRPLTDVMKKYGVSRCYYGHIHGKYSLPQSVDFEGIKMILISADFLDFTPQRVFSRG